MIDPNEIEIEWVDADPFDDMIDVIASMLLEDKAIEGQSLAIIDELVGAMTLPEDEQGDA